MLPLIPGLISAGTSLLGGILGQQNQASINAANIAEQDKINQQNIAMQEEFAKNGIQWKVEDAKAAGINPLAALGASTNSFSNVVGATQQSSNALGDAIGKGGQDIGRALQDTMTAGDQHNQLMQKLAETHGQLENDLLASQIAKYNNAGAGGPNTPAAGQKYLLPGQGPTVDPNTANTKPDIVSVAPGLVSAGVNPGSQFVRSPTGGWTSIPSNAFSKGTSNDFIANAMWEATSRIGGLLNPNPPAIAPDPGYKWSFNPVFNEYFQEPLYGRMLKNTYRGATDFIGKYGAPY